MAFSLSMIESVDLSVSGTPISEAFNLDPSAKDHCIKTAKLFRGITISNLLTDVIILCLPLFMIWRLQLALQHQIIVSGLFMLGGIVCIVSLLRTITQTGKEDWSNPTKALMKCGLWAIIEPEIAVLCACLPTLRPIFSNQELVARWSGKIGESCSNMTNRSSWYGITSGNSKKLHRNAETAKHDVQLEDFGTLLQNGENKSNTGRTSRISGGMAGKSCSEHEYNHLPAKGIHVKKEVSLDVV